MIESPNVLLVVLDSARAQNMSLYGYERRTTPFLEAFADRATVYTQARAPGIHSIASHVSMFTGVHVDQHEAFHHTARIDPSRSIWPELRSEHGHATGLFTNNRIVSNASNLGTHFEYQFTPAYPLAKRLENSLGNPLVERAYFRLSDLGSRVAGYVPGRRAGASIGGAVEQIGTRLPGGATGGDGSNGDTGGDGSNESPPSHGFKTRHGSEYADGFLEWEARQDGPWAACINLMDTHSPYHPEPEHDRWADEDAWSIQQENGPSVRETMEGSGWERLAALEGLYDGTIHQADAVVRDLVETLRSRNSLSETLVIVTSDHGEAFGEQSRIDPTVRLRDHKWGIHEVLTHVPLVVQFPGQTDGEVVDDVVSLTDLPVLIRAAVEGTPNLERTVLPDGPVLSSTYRLPETKTTKFRSVEGVERYVGPWRAVYQDRDGAVRKFARRGDGSVTVDVEAPGEARVVTRSDRGRVMAVYERLERSGVVTDRTSDIDEELESHLEHLGYIR